MSALHAVDLDSDQMRAILVGAARLGSGGQGRMSMMSERRAGFVVDEVLSAIRATCENLEPLIAEIRASTAATELETQRSAARRARLEHALGLAEVVRGEVTQ